MFLVNHGTKNREKRCVCHGDVLPEAYADATLDSMGSCGGTVVSSGRIFWLYRNSILLRHNQAHVVKIPLFRMQRPPRSYVLYSPIQGQSLTGVTRWAFGPRTPRHERTPRNGQCCHGSGDPVFGVSYRLRQGGRDPIFLAKKCTTCIFLQERKKGVPCCRRRFCRSPGETPGLHSNRVTRVNDRSYAVPRERSFAPPAGRKILFFFTKNLHVVQIFCEKDKRVPCCRRQIGPFIQANV